MRKNSNIPKELVNAFTQALAFKDMRTHNHSYRLKDIAESFGKKIGLTEEGLKDLTLLAQLHDIGKLDIPDRVLNKPDKLDEAEWEIMKTHSLLGCLALKLAVPSSKVADYILMHHERWDGQGYPDGLKGKDIPLHARVIAILDAFDAILSERPYKKSKSVAYALAEIQRCSGTRFDPKLVAVFQQVTRENFTEE